MSKAATDVAASMKTLAALWTPNADVPEGSTAAELRGYVEALQKAHTRISAVKVICCNCMHYDIDSCGLYGAVPPADFQKTENACEDWRYDGLPW